MLCEVLHRWICPGVWRMLQRVASCVDQCSTSACPAGSVISVSMVMVVVVSWTCVFVSVLDQVHAWLPSVCVCMCVRACEHVDKSRCSRDCRLL